jgi:hypothetical protein
MQKDAVNAADPERVVVLPLYRRRNKNPMRPD